MYRLIVFLFLETLTLFPAIADNNCQNLISFGTIKLVQLANDARLYVPVEIAGAPKLMLLDTGSERTVITKTAADELHLSSRWTETAFYDAWAGKANHMASAPFKLGALNGDVTFWMYSTAQANQSHDPHVAGTLGYDVLMKFDVAIDFGAQTLTLFSPEHCEGKVVYWPERPVVAIPFRFKKVTLQRYSPLPPMDKILFVFPISLDHQEVKGLLASGDEASSIEQRKAVGKFDLMLGAPNVPDVATAKKLFGYEVAPNQTHTSDYMAQSPLNPPDNTAKRAKRDSTFTHRFGSVAFGNITVNNPEIHIVPDVEIHPDLQLKTGTLLDRESRAEEKNESLIRLGINLLQHLRVYVAYRDRMIYVSPASTEKIGTTRMP